MWRTFTALVAIGSLVLPQAATAQSIATATTTLTLSVCGNMIVDVNEDCDVPGETGVYSQTIIGRQCTPQCLFGPYCGDGILQTLHGEECDDGNNDSGDFCSEICKIEPAGSGGGGTSGGNSGGGGGSSRPIGDTVINITGRAYPSRTINFILDGDNVGSVQSNSSGAFEFSTKSSPGTATLGIWANDSAGTRSVTFNNTFDVTQGAVTNLNDLILPPSLKVSRANFNPGETITVSGQAVPNATINLYIDRNTTSVVASGQAGSNGLWSIEYNTSRLSTAEHTLRARSVTGTPPLTTQSSFSSSVQLFAGVEGRATTPSDLSRDGKVNLTDFSILIFWWNTAGGDSDPPADINGNGRVSLEDFSILLFNWTG
jgi:cysteine-rich repeat protein